MARKLDIQLLGAPTFIHDGRNITSKLSGKAQALLAYLAVNRRPYSREFLAEMLWEDRPPEQTQANFRSLLSGARRHLGPFLEVTRQTVALAGDISLDVTAFETAVQTCLAQAGPALSDAEASRLATALDLYTNDLLAGFYVRDSRVFEEWLVLEQERLRRLAVTALQRLVTYYLENGRYTAGLRYGEQLRGLDPLNETAVRHIMLLLARSGQRNAALAHYQDARERLSRDLGVEPTAPTRTLYERLRTAGPLRPLKLPPGNTPFIGRTSEIEAVFAALLQSRARLVTLLGPGGIGKTRLAQETARRLASDHPGRFLHGIIYISLAGSDEYGALLGALSAGLQIESEPGSAPEESIASFLADKEILIVLDDFESLLAPAYAPRVRAWLSDLLAAAPDVSLLVTSRERLQLQEEWLFDIEGLAYPSGPGAPAPDSYASGSLFLQSVRRRQHQLSPTEVDWPAIAAICRQLEGTPLALELAAAGVRQQSFAAVASALNQNLGQLRSDARNVSKRHASLQAIFDHSWERLSAQERSATTALSVFVGAFAPTAVYEIAGIAPTTLRDLADKAILRPIANGTVEGRYNMHAVLRHFAGEHLSRDTAAAVGLERAHSRYYLRLLQSESEHFDRPGHVTAVERLAIVAADIREAWRRALAAGRWEEIALAAEPLMKLHWARSQLHAGRQALQRAVDIVAEAAPERPLLHAKLRLYLANFLLWLGDFDAVSVHVGAIRPLFEAAVENALLAEVAILSTNLAFFTGDHETALREATTALAIYRALEDEDGIANALNARANILCERVGGYEAAMPDYEQSLALYRRRHNQGGEAKVLLNLGSLAHARERYREARTYYEATVVLSRRLGNRRTLAIALGNLARVAAAEGDHAAASALANESLALKRSIGDRRSLVYTLMAVAAAAREREDFAVARATFGEALDLAETLGADGLTIAVLNAIAYLWLAEGYPREAFDLAGRTLATNPTDVELRQEAEALRDRALQQLPAGEPLAKAVRETPPTLPTLIASTRHTLHQLP